MKTPPRPHVHFPGLHGLRFFAALAVAVSHVELLKQYLGYPNRYDSPALYELGRLSVTFFFVLSGFLITYLLLVEKESSGAIAVRAFYLRRVLRIWPLYYGYLLLAMVLLPLVWAMPQPLAETLGRHLFPFLTFTGNFSYAYFPAVQYAGHLWTISTEEQFYLMVPILVMFSPRVGKLLIAWGIGLLFFTAAVRFYIQWNAVKYPMIWILPAARMDPFVIGAACAWICAYRQRWLDRRYSGTALFGAGLSGFALVLQGDYITSGSFNLVWEFSLIAFAAGCFLLAALSRNGIGAALSLRPIVFLGKISFGLYVYHLFAILFEAKVIQIGESLGRTPATWLLTLTAVFTITALLASMSYYGFERRFILLKAQFGRVKSRPA